MLRRLGKRKKGWTRLWRCCRSLLALSPGPQRPFLLVVLRTPRVLGMGPHAFKTRSEKEKRKKKKEKNEKKKEKEKTWTRQQVPSERAWIRTKASANWIASGSNRETSTRPRRSRFWTHGQKKKKKKKKKKKGFLPWGGGPQGAGHKTPV